MKQYLKLGSILVFIFISSIQLKAKDIISVPRKSVGIYFGPGYNTTYNQSYHLGVRGKYALNKYFAMGAEANYIQFLGPYSNSDALGGIWFLNLSNSNKGLYAQAGFQGYSYISSVRSKSEKMVLPYLALGYNLNLKRNLGIDFQYRTSTAFNNKTNEGSDRNNWYSKLFIGLNYNF